MKFVIATVTDTITPNSECSG